MSFVKLLGGSKNHVNQLKFVVVKQYRSKANVSLSVQVPQLDAEVSQFP